MVWIQGDEIHNQFERGPYLPGHDQEAINAGQKAEFDMMKQNTVLYLHGTGASIVSIQSSESLQISSTILLLFLHETSVRYAADSKVTAPLILLAFHICVSINAKYQSPQFYVLLSQEHNLREQLAVFSFVCDWLVLFPHYICSPPPPSISSLSNLFRPSRRRHDLSPQLPTYLPACLALFASRIRLTRQQK